MPLMTQRKLVTQIANRNIQWYSHSRKAGHCLKNWTCNNYVTQQLHSVEYFCREMESCTHKKNLYINVHTNLIDNNPKLDRLRHTLTGEWLSRPHHIHMMESHLAIQKTKLLMDARIWMNLLRILLSEKGQSVWMSLCNMLYESTYITFFKWQNFIEIENRLVFATGYGEDVTWREVCVAIKGQQEGSLDDGNVLYLDYQCRHPGCDIVLKFCKMSPLDETFIGLILFLMK